MISPEAAVDAINDRYGSHHARALHAKGAFYRASFTASAEAASLTSAAHMQGGPVDALVRFSNGAGDPSRPDYAPDVRGMATTFFLPDGSRTDISAQTVSRFPTRTPDAFIQLVQADKPGPGRFVKIPLFLLTHPSALPALRAGAAGLAPPPSFAARRYYAIHAFRWVGSDGGSRYVRYTWRPHADEGRISRGDARKGGRDYLFDELAQRLEREPVRFTLELQVAASGDPTDDPAAVWPDSRERVEAGVLEVTAIDRTAETDGSPIVLDPTRVTEGIELSDDPVLNFRPKAYDVSVQRRSG